MMRHDPKAEGLFTSIQVFTAIVDSFGGYLHWSLLGVPRLYLLDLHLNLLKMSIVMVFKGLLLFV